MTSESAETQATKGLHVYYNDDCEEWYVAASPADARAAWVECCGEPPEDMPMDADSWRLVPDDKMLKIDCDDGLGITTKTVAEWIIHNGRGHLCSANW